MIGTLVLYGLAFVGALSLITAVGVLVFTWRLPERTDPGVIDEQRHEFEHAQWRNAHQELTHVRLVPPAPGEVWRSAGTGLPVGSVIPSDGYSCLDCAGGPTWPTREGYRNHRIESHGWPAARTLGFPDDAFDTPRDAS